MASVLSAKHFHDEQAAYEFIEARVWAEGRVCPHCGVVERSGKLQGKSTRIGVYKCYACRKPFTVKVGTIFEDSHIKLHIWLQAIFLLCSSKKGISSNQLARTLGVTLKSAWFLSHRIRHAMATDGGVFGAGGETIEMDETYYGRDNTAELTAENPARPHKDRRPKRAVVSLVQRDGVAKSFHVTGLNQENMRNLITANVSKEARLLTDESRLYFGANNLVNLHETIKHTRGEYARGDVHTNTVEGYFSIFKRGMRGIYQQCSEKHLHRYLAEFDFRYNNRMALNVNDTQRAENALRGVVGKRLTYQTVGQRPEA